MVKYFCSFCVCPRMMLWFLVTLLTNKTNCQKPVQQDMLLLSEKLVNGIKWTCVVANPGCNSAISFMESTLNENISSYTSTGSYYSVKGDHESSINCDFEESSNCTKKWERRDDIKITKSSRYKIGPVTDERWEKFPTYITKGERNQQQYSIQYNIREDINEDFNIGLSLRADRNAHIILCEGLPKSSKCYWVLLDSGKNQIYQLIRRCPNGIQDKPRFGEECFFNRHEGQFKEAIDLLRDSDWNHFIISLRKNELVIWDSGNDRELLKFIDEDLFKIKFMYLNSYNNAVGHWKIHSYKYISLMESKSPIKLMRFSGQYTGSICISLYVAVCSGCFINLQLKSEEEHFDTDIYINENSTNFSTWENFKIKRNITKGTVYTLYAQGMKASEDLEQFWSIDDIRECQENEVRMSDVIINGNEDIKCQILNNPEWMIEKVEIDSNSQICTDSRFVGAHCNMSCRSITGEEFCEKKLICQNVKTGNGKICTCSAGYEGLYCEKPCSTFDGGYKCTKPCTSCKYGHKCNKEKGSCILNNYSEPDENKSEIPEGDDHDPLLHSASIGDRKTVEFLLESGKDVNSRDSHRNSPLILSAMNGHKGVVDLLLSKNASINQHTNDGQTALLFSAFHNHPEIVELLLNKGADPNVKDYSGNTALIWAAFKGYTKVVELLLKYKNVDINVQSNDGHTALIWATAKGYIEIVKILLESGADRNVQNNGGNTALKLAVVTKRKNIFELLNSK